MSISPKHMKYVALSLIIIVFSISFNILSNKVKIHTLELEKPLIITIDENLPLGEYYLEYYVSCSGSKTSDSVLEFNLKTIDNNGIEILFDRQKYNKAFGFGISSFQIKATDDIVIAEFNRIEQIKGKDKSANSANVGNVYIRSKDGSYRKTVYTPNEFGNQAQLTEHNVTVNSNIQLSDFAILKNYSLVEKSLELKILCIKETSGNYELGLKISCDNINALLPDGKYYGFYPLTPNTSSWIAGEEYIQRITFDLIPGHYDLELALSAVSPDVPYYINRYRLMDNNYKINIGSIDIHGQSLSEFLRNVSDGQIIIISVMDDATNALNEMSLISLAELGLESDLSGKIRWSYIGIAAKGIDGFMPLECLQNTQTEVFLPSGSLIGTLAIPFNLNVISAGYETGNTSSIKINDQEYSQSKRGMNIVVYDINKNEVVNSVNFDTYLTNYN